jgi:hypothetical protein
MNAKQLRHLYNHSCYNKIRHKDALSATLHAVRLDRKHPSNSLRIYVCDFCNGLHVGHCRRRFRVILDENFFEKVIWLKRIKE